MEGNGAVRVDEMGDSRHRFGEGEYRYFADPLPEPVGALRAGVYRHLAPAAQRWLRDLREPLRLPPLPPPSAALQASP